MRVPSGCLPPRATWTSVLCGYGPACAGRASPTLSPALTPGQRRRRRRLDQETAKFGNPIWSWRPTVVRADGLTDHTE